MEKGSKRKPVGGRSVRSEVHGVKVKGLWQKGNHFYWRTQKDGKRVNYALGTTDRTEALEKIFAYQQRPDLLNAGVWEHEVRLYLSTAMAQGRISRFFAPSRLAVLLAFGRSRNIGHPREVTGPTAQAWYDEKKASNPNTAKSYISHLSAFYAWLIEEKKVHENPAKEVKMDRTRTKARTRFVPAAKVQKILASVEDPEMLFVLYCGFEAGMRKNEIIEARPEWFDLPGKAIHLTVTPTFEPKGRDNRTIPLKASFKAFLESYGKPSPYMIRPEVERGEGRYRTEFKKPFLRIMKDNGVPWATMHTMRHSFASNLVSAGVSIYKVAKWLGDTVQTTEDHYGHLAPQDSDIERMG